MSNDQAEGLRSMMGSSIGEFPNVPEMMLHHAERARIISRQDDIREVVMPLIETASNEELQQIVSAIKNRAVYLNGCAPELENWLVLNRREIESQNEL